MNLECRSRRTSTLGSSLSRIPSPNATCDVAFLHGLDGDQVKIWQHDPKHPELSWPNLLAADLTSVRVWALGYPAEKFGGKFARAMSIVTFISFPITPFSAIMFGAATGLTWLSTVPPTSALVALMFGTRWFSTLFGFAFVSHQVGGFLGVLLGGIVFEKFGSYGPIWWLSVLFGVLSALINLPIVEAPVARPVAQAA